MRRFSKLCLLALGLFGTTGINAQEQPTWKNTDLSRAERVASLIKEMTLEEKVSQMTNNNVDVPRLDINSYNWWNECLHGVARNGRATVFPQAIGLAATFDEDLVFKVSSAIGAEARVKYAVSQEMGNRSQYAGLTFWTPNVNIFRDPRWGRGQETYGEDPFLAGTLGTQFVKGLQGDNEQYLQAAACAKHFAVHSGPEEDRHVFDAVPSKQDLYETYLPAFEMLVKEGNVEAVMGAYNRVYGEPACGSEFLLEEILRKEWGFDGHVVSDCGAIEDFYAHHKTSADAVEAAALALKAGTDLNCGNVYGPNIIKAIERGLITEELVNIRLANLLNTKMKLGMFDPIDDNPYYAFPQDTVGCDAHRALAKEAATKSIVLLKNTNNVLPLSPQIKNLYVVGPNANTGEVLLGNYYGMTDNMTSILEGIVGAVSLGTTINYKQGILLDRENVNPIDWSTGEAAAADACIAVMGISGLLEGEEGEAIASTSKGDRKDIGLPKNQVNYLKKIKSKSKNPLIVVITGGSPMALPEIEEIADAIVFAWYPGQEGGDAVADVLFGKTSPSGRLPITFPRSLDQLPAYEDYTMKGRTYRYMDQQPLYPFGFGLSYSSFEYSDIKLSKSKIKRKDNVTVTATITNTGKVAAEEVVQLYLSGYSVKFDAPNLSLKGFKRISLKPNESVEVSFELTPKMRTIFDENGEPVNPKGTLNIHIAGAAPMEVSKSLGVQEQKIALNIK